MGSQARKSTEERPNLEKRKQRRAELIQRLSEKHIIVATPTLPCYDFKAFPHNMLSTTGPSEYIQGVHIGSVRLT